jgi:hypothetical protein
MKHHESWLQQLVVCLESARTIVFALAAFSVAAVYISAFSSAAQRAELLGQQAERARLADLLKRADAAFSRIRAFYEGPVEADLLNFSSLIYTLEVTDHHLRRTLQDNVRAGLTPKDLAFLDFEAALIQDNVFELGSVIGGLIKQKKERVPFDSLSTSDLLDLDYHKGKDAWNLYYEWSSLRYALYTEASYGYRKLPAEVISLEQRFRYHQSEAQKSRQSSTRPPKAGRDPEVAAFIQTMVGTGFGSVGELRARLIALDNKIREQERAIGGSLKLPFIDQSVEVDYLIWLVPLTVLISMAFALFYVQRARNICLWLDKANSDLKASAQAFPWVFLEPADAGRSAAVLSRSLKVTLIALPLGVPVFMLVTSSGASVAGRTSGAILAILSFLVVWIVLRELRALKAALWNRNTADAPAVPDDASETG